jgi:DNA-3-methyladenine glycosylase I
LTILKKRDAYRKQFKQFNVNKVASLTSEDVEHIMQSDVVKHKKKIEAIVNNAKLFQDIITEYNSINSFFWSYVNYESIIIKMENYSKNQTRSDISDQLTKDLKKRGFKFVGSVTMYAFMQASGMINAHEIDCICSRKLLK